MKKIILLLMLLLLPIVSAYSEVAYGYSDSYYGFYGQNQYYYTVFDGEGEAAVVARLEIQNTNNLTDLEFSIPGEDVEIIRILQEYYDYSKECTYWGELACTTEDGKETCAQECLNYELYPVYPASYAEVEYTTEVTDSELYVFSDIPKQNQENIYLIVYYKTSSYVDKGLFSYKYNFQTIQNEYDTTNVRVSIDVAEDLYLQGLNSEISYRDEIAKESSADLASFVSGIGYIDTGYTETASSLDPYESFTVEGRYAKFWWCIHWWKVLIGVLAAGALIFLAVLGIKKVNKKDKKLGLSLLLGGSSGILLWGLWFGTMMFLNNYSYWSYGMIQIFVIMLAVLMTLLLLFIPSIFIGIKHGINEGLYCFITTVGVLFVLGVLTVLIYILFFTESYPIVYY